METGITNRSSPHSTDQPALSGQPGRPTRPFIEFTKADIEQSIPARFEQQVARYPDRLAVKVGDRALTYGALNALANRVAWAILDRRGPRPEPIALLLEHDVAALAAILGILKAGKFYVPLDPSHPRARSAQVLDDARAELILTSSGLLPAAGELAMTGARLLNLDDREPGLHAENPGLTIAPDAFAYILYTSGSSGRPKGVVDNHRNVLHNVMRYTNGLRIGADDRLTLLQSCSNSGSVSSLFGALLNGAAVFPFDLRREGVSRLAAWLAREEITIYHSVPAIFRHLPAGDERFPRLRLIRLEGDQALKSDVELYQRHFGADCVLVNGLGITETGLIRRYVVDRHTRISGSALPVGYPVEDCTLLLLDERGRPVPTGRVGEIAVKSRYLAPGYWGRPDLTQAAFRPAPGGERLYRTGDLGRLRPDGCLEYLGRKDFRAKIRGHRVEVAEIELALLDLDGIEEAVVVAREDEPGNPRLVAYVVPARSAAPTVSALRRGLAATLPDYILPSAFVFLDALPRNANGKPDRRALPAPGQARPALDQAFVPPRSPLERLLVDIWADLLRLGKVGIWDEFLALGGDSLLATKLVARVRDAVGVELPLALLFQAPTVADQATALVEYWAEQAGESELGRLLARLESLAEEQVGARPRNEPNPAPPRPA